MKRYLEKFILEDLEKKMVFIGGPRQVGKTTLTQTIGEKHFSHYQYLNWDLPDDRKKILKFEFQPDVDLLVFDEIHKYKDWKNHLKGFYDTQKNHQKYKIIVTGSARLDLYRKGGDSMLGRYFYQQIHPISIAETLQKTPQKREFQFLSTEEVKEKKLEKTKDDLLRLGGFPESFLEKDARNHRRWQQERIQRIIREDIRDVKNIREFSLFQIFVSLLPEKVGGLFSLNSLREDLQVSHHTLSSWAEILENFYYIYRLKPYERNPVKSLKRESKLFLWDWSEVEESGARFENFIGSHLLKYVNFRQNIYGEKLALNYIRDREKREVDFLITEKNSPKTAIEVKMSDTKISKNLKYFQKKFEIPHCYQVVNTENIDFEKEGIRVISASKFLTGLV